MQKNFVIALAAIGTADAWAAVIRALSADNPYVRDAALSVLEPKTAGHFGFDPRRAPGEQVKSLKKFRGWWEKTFKKKWED